MKYIKFLITTLVAFVTISSCAQKPDDIEGIWTVDNEYSKATYEIIEVENKFYGKVQKFKSDTDSYVGNNEEKDYFLMDLEKKDNAYINGKMYYEKGKLIDIQIQLITTTELKIKMTIEGQPYSENWKKKE